MKTIGLIGGLSWESSVEYYRIINQETQRRLGGLHSARCLMFLLTSARSRLCKRPAIGTRRPSA